MPRSPLIRPLSPLQTRCAPPLPVPYSLADVVLHPVSAAASPDSAHVRERESSASAAVVSEAEVHHPDRLAGRIGAGLALQEADSSPALALLPPPPLAPTFHSLVGPSLELELLHADYAARLQAGHSPHTRTTGDVMDDVRACPPAAAATPSRSHRAASPPQRGGCTSPSHPYVSTTRAGAGVPQREAPRDAPPDTPSSLLRSAAAATAMEAARPSYGGALLERRQRARRADRPREYEHLQPRHTPPSSPLPFEGWDDATGKRTDVATTPPSSSRPELTVAASGRGDVSALRQHHMTDAADAARYHGTAVIDRTGCSYTISIAACPIVEEKDGAPSAQPQVRGQSTGHNGSNSERGSEAGKRKHVLDAPHEAAEVALHSAGASRRAGARNATPPPNTDVSATQLAYPALDECRRLLDEIRTVSPLLRRCLTPPRPMGCRAAAASTTPHPNTTVARGGAAVHAQDAGRGGYASSSSPPLPPPPAAVAGPAETRAVSEAAPRLSIPAPGPEARRLYRWDAATAAEDLSYMCGPFQQPSERFAASVAAQMQRRQSAETRRLFGAAPAVSAAEVDAPAHGPPRRWSTLSSVPSASTLGSAVPPRHGVPAQGAADESPSERLQRLLQETEVALSSRWGTGPLHQQQGMAAPPPSARHHHYASDGMADVARAGTARTLDMPDSSTASLLRLPYCPAALTPARPPIPLSSYEDGGRYRVWGDSC
ncbi:hypothetical protein NESM_000041100 [Novymonas esmeraldas]|uniref:Uncharacterized protein n=1 Tax=Novymonas esmeraldas TaxID=1808958 RepID=A0AAW0F1F8_9TRYP